MKFKSIFQKLLVYSISVTLIGLVLLSVILNISLQNMLYKKKETALFNQADHLVYQYQQAQDPLYDSLYNTTVAFNKKKSNVKMDLLFIGDQTNPNKIEKQSHKLLKKEDINDSKIITDVLSGKRISHIGIFKKNSNKEMVSVGVPFKKNNKIIGAIFLHTPVKEVHSVEISKIIIFVSIIIAIPAIISLYWISRKISKPLVQMTQAAGSIGKGDFKERILVESEDEVGQLASTFNSMAEKLELLEKLRKELIMNVSHELRTPLTSVRGFIQGILEGVIPPDQHKKYLNISFQEIQRLSSLLNTMLDLSAIESGKITLKSSLLQWERLVSAVTESIKVRLEEKNISFKAHSEDKTPLKLFGDPDRVKQVLFNLLDNAVRHTPIGGSISIYSKDTGNYLEVSLFNSGNGIAPEILPHIWERFYTEESSRKSHRERSGLGLTITKQLIELMGGMITVESHPGIGATFTFTLPNCK